MVSGACLVVRGRFVAAQGACNLMQASFGRGCSSVQPLRRMSYYDSSFQFLPRQMTSSSGDFAEWHEKLNKSEVSCPICLSMQ